MDTHDATVSLAALAQVSRLAVFRHLVELGPTGANPSDIAQALEVPANTLSFHLKTLNHAGLISAEPSGRNIRYRANFVAMQELVDFLTRNCCGGDASLCVPMLKAPLPPGRGRTACAPPARVRLSDRAAGAGRGAERGLG